MIDLQVTKWKVTLTLGMGKVQTIAPKCGHEKKKRVEYQNHLETTQFYEFLAVQQNQES